MVFGGKNRNVARLRSCAAVLYLSKLFTRTHSLCL